MHFSLINWFRSLSLFIALISFTAPLQLSAMSNAESLYSSDKGISFQSEEESSEDEEEDPDC